MNRRAAIQAMLFGEKITHENWNNNTHILMNDFGQIVDNDGVHVVFDSLYGEGWHFYTQTKIVSMYQVAYKSNTTPNAAEISKFMTLEDIEDQFTDDFELLEWTEKKVKVCL